MSTHNTSNFVHELVTMAQAVEELPKLQAEIARLQALVASHEYELSARESHIELLRNSNEELSSKLRSAEVERDNAGFRELAATDALDSIKKVMQTTFHNLGETLKSVTPQPVMEPTPVIEEVPVPLSVTTGTGSDSSGVSASTIPAGQSDPIPPTAPTTAEPWPLPYAAFGTADASGGASSGTEASPGPGESQSVPLPTGQESSASGVGEASSPASVPSTGEYAGKIYYDMPKYISEHDWLAGGGSYEAYHWRPHFGARPAA